MKITNNQGLPAPFVAMVSRNYYSKGASQYSVTELMAPPKIKRLRERYEDEIVVDAASLIDVPPWSYHPLNRINKIFFYFIKWSICINDAVRNFLQKCHVPCSD